MSVLEYKRNQVSLILLNIVFIKHTTSSEQLLLSLARTIFEDTSSLDVLINKIMVKAKGMLDCEVCRVYLVDNEHDAVDAKVRMQFLGSLTAFVIIILHAVHFQSNI